MNFGQIGRQTIELPRCKHTKYTAIYNGENDVYIFFLVVYLLKNYSKYLITCLLSSERSLHFGLLVSLTDVSKFKVYSEFLGLHS